MGVVEYNLIFCLLIFSLVGKSQTQENNTEHHFKHFRGSFALGQTYIPQATSGDAKFVVVPTLGIDLQYWIHPKWGIGLKNDVEIANYVLEENSGGTTIIRDNPVIVAIPLLLSPWENHFTFIIGPAVELESHENFFVFRAGVGSEFEVGNHWDFAPEIIYDLKDGHINTLTFAIAVGRRF